MKTQKFHVMTSQVIEELEIPGPYGQLFDECPTPLFYVDGDGAILKLNEAAGKFLGAQKARVLGTNLKNWFSFSAPNFNAPLWKTGVEFRLKGAKSGKIFGILSRVQGVSEQVFLLRLQFQNGSLFPDHRVQELRRKIENLQNILSLSEQLLSNSNLEAALNSVLDAVSERLGSNGCAVSLLQKNRKGLILVAQKSENQRFRIGKIGESVPFKILEISFRAVQEKRAVYIPDIRSESGISRRIRDYYRLVGLISILDVPMIGPNGVLGVLHINQYEKSRRYEADEVEFAQTVANQAAMAILNAQLHEKERSAFARLERARAQLLEAGKLSVIGQLSAAVAHEIRNPLGAITNSISVLQRDMEFSGVYRELIDIVAKETERIKKITDDFLLFARPRKPVLEEVDLMELIRSEISVLQKDPEHFEKIEFEVRGPVRLFLRADRRQMLEVFENLFLNSAAAMEGQGQIEVRVEKKVRQKSVFVEIEDFGPGVPPNILPQIFEPFFSTRSSGTGLGLPIVKRIVEEMGGKIQIENGLRGGAKVRLTFPLNLK